MGDEDERKPAQDDARPGGPVGDRFGAALGFEVLEADTGRAKLRSVVRPEHTNAAGTAHGGYLFSLCDAAFALAVNSGGREGPAIVTHMEYFRAVREGQTIVAEAVDLHAGRHVATCKVELSRQDDGELVGHFVGTAYLSSAAGPEKNARS